MYTKGSICVRTILLLLAVLLMLKPEKDNDIATVHWIVHDVQPVTIVSLAVHAQVQ